MGGTVKSILHDYATFNWVMTGSDTFACEGNDTARYAWLDAG